MKFQQKTHVLAAAFVMAAAVFPAAAAGAPQGFRAPAVPAQSLTLPMPKAADLAPEAPTGRALEVGSVRALPKAATLSRWERVPGGYVARLRAESPTAEGLRVRLDLGAMPGAMEVRVQGSSADRIEAMVLDPVLGTDAWTPWTGGPAQTVELFSPVAPSADAVRVGAMVHFTRSPMAKAALSCTLSTACTSNDPALDAQIEERKKSSIRITFVSGSRSFVCSATLIDTPRNPAAYVLTANHCIDQASVANSISAFWFWESSPCTPPVTTNPGFVQQSGGMQLVFNNPNVDSTLLLMNQSPPAGAVFAPLNAALIANGTSVVSISHPDGDTSRWAVGAMEGLARASSSFDQTYDGYIVLFSRGMVQGGSSGSGIYVRANGRLELSGLLSLGPLAANCESPPGEKFGLYSRLEVFHPMMAQYIGASSPPPDDAPNRTIEASTNVAGGPLDARAQPVAIAGRIDYAGDIDIYRFTLNEPAAVTLYTEGAQDLVAAILDSNGLSLEANDDAQTRDTNAGITRVLGAGTYYAHVAHWLPNGTGNYSAVLRADRVDPNHTALWWNAQESGWGINVNHQGNIVFATLFTYDDGGNPMWLVMSRGERQADGAYSGALHRTTGPAFNASPWGAIGATEVGTMRISFSSDSSSALLAYTVNGRSVSKLIARQLFKQPPTCSWSFFDRSYESNFTDLWWNPAESGWGLNLAHQENTVFATLFTYAANGQGMWLVMPEGNRAEGPRYSGALFRTRGPAFDASPWSAITPTQVGTMTLDFASGNSGTLTYTVDGVSVTKSIERQVFSTLKTKCD